MFTPYNLVIDSKFTANGRTFKVIGMSFMGGKCTDYRIREIMAEPTVQDDIMRTYEQMEQLIKEKKIILL
jgi:hypothetical protein